MNWNATMALFTTSRAELAPFPEHEELGKRVQIVLNQLQIKLSPYDVPANQGASIVLIVSTQSDFVK